MSRTILTLATCCAVVLLYKDARACEHLLTEASTARQWLSWEQKANVEIYRKASRPIAFDSHEIPRAQVEIWRSSTIKPTIENLFLNQDLVRWPKHPFNQDARVPFADTPVTSKNWRDFSLSASRSVVDLEHQISMKVGTDHPHGLEGPSEPDKALMADDIQAAILRMQHIDDVDRKAPLEPLDPLILKEVMAVVDPVSREGFMVRDLSPLFNGHHYLPAFSLPFVGESIAKSLGAEPLEFWREHYAKALGRAKARLLLRYGLQLETPNPQNILIQLDAEFRPTGRLVIRDIADTEFVGPIAHALGFSDKLTEDKNWGFEASPHLHPNWWNSSMHFEVWLKSGSLESWAQAHDEAYIEELAQAIGEKRSAGPRWLNKIRAFKETWWPAPDRVRTFEQILFTRTSLIRLSRSRNVSEYP